MQPCCAAIPSWCTSSGRPRGVSGALRHPGHRGGPGTRLHSVRGLRPPARRHRRRIVLSGLRIAHVALAGAGDSRATRRDRAQFEDPARWRAVPRALSLRPLTGAGVEARPADDGAPQLQGHPRGDRTRAARGDPGLRGRHRAERSDHPPARRCRCSAEVRVVHARPARVGGGLPGGAGLPGALRAADVRVRTVRTAGEPTGRERRSRGQAHCGEIP